MTKIDYSPIKLSRQNPTQILPSYIELSDNFFTYHLEFHADEPIHDDESLGWENIFNYSHNVVSKKCLAGIELSFVSQSKVWKITFPIWGYENDLKLYFKTKTRAEDVFNTIRDWFTSL